mmetsp:Transcript_47498/g.152519  ORF Transcript_47498/g.152519 Transcript_47498/m.152519 type:complete len:91 (+) Transcript_47498:424-696(+)
MAKASGSDAQHLSNTWWRVTSTSFLHRSPMRAVLRVAVLAVSSCGSQGSANMSRRASLLQMEQPPSTGATRAETADEVQELDAQGCANVA